ncbi:MAG: porin family protein [Prevotella sp.]|nr:porin family protein [Prevotella sp.]
MKKIFSVALLAFVFAASANAQLKLGVKGGLNVTDMSLDSKVFDASNQAGYFFGPTIKFSLPIVGLGVDAAALYDHRSAKVKEEVSGHEETLKQDQVVVPVNLRYGIGLGDTASLFLFAGPQFGFNVGDKEQKIWNQAAQWKLKTSNFSVNVGLGATLLKHLQVSASYNIACGKTGDIEASDVLKTVVKSKEDVKNNAWQIAVAYYF